MRVLAVISTLLIGATVALAWRSANNTDLVGIAISEEHLLTADSYDGAVVLGLHTGGHGTKHRRPRWALGVCDYGQIFEQTLTDPAHPAWQFAGVRYVHAYSNMGTLTAYTLRLPYWLIALLLSPPILRSIYRQRRRAMRKAGRLCLSCGYDLRHTPDRCPECGLSV